MLTFIFSLSFSLFNFLEDSIKAYSYSDKSLITSTPGQEIELIKLDNCTSENKTCQTYFRYNSEHQ